MQYPDLERRLEELKKIEDIFSRRKFSETSNRIKMLRSLINEPIISITLKNEYYELLMIFAKEFSQRYNFGQEYRLQCFKEIADLMFGAATSNTPAKFRKSILELEPIFISLNNGKKIIDEIAQGLKNTDEKTFFHLLCYSYLIIVEGIFDELIRVIYFLSALKNGNDIPIEQLKRLETYDVYNKINPKPIILKNWIEKKHTRNAIGHATVYYEPSKKEVTFIDNYGKSEPFKETLQLNAFIEHLTELESASEAFILFTILLKVKDILFAETAFDYSIEDQ
jgi:hypothetical protein